MKKTYHLIEVRRGLEPITQGPFLEENERDDAAKAIHRAQSDEDSLFWADTDEQGGLSVGSYMADFFQRDPEWVETQL